MIINDTIFNVDVIDIITELKSQLSANGIQLFEKYFDSGDDVMICCPYHKDGQERRPSAGIRKTDGLFHCLACGKTAGIDELVADCFGHPDPIWGHRWLLKNFKTTEVEKREPIKVDIERDTLTRKSAVLGGDISDRNICRITDEELDSYRYTHKYMYKRGLTDDIIDLFDIGYDVSTDSITFPVKDSTGNCLFVARRSVHSKRFDLPSGIDKPLYGLYEVCQKGLLVTAVGKVYVTEGLFDCLRLWCNGKYAVAGFGCLFNKLQVQQLQSLPIRHIVLALDNDKAGRDGADRIRRVVKNKLITQVVIPNGKKDIGELTDEEIQNLEEVF